MAAEVTVVAMVMESVVVMEVMGVDMGAEWGLVMEVGAEIITTLDYTVYLV